MDIGFLSAQWSPGADVKLFGLRLQTHVKVERPARTPRQLRMAREQDVEPPLRMEAPADADEWNRPRVLRVRDEDAHLPEKVVPGAVGRQRSAIPKFPVVTVERLVEVGVERRLPVGLNDEIVVDEVPDSQPQASIIEDIVFRAGDSAEVVVPRAEMRPGQQEGVAVHGDGDQCLELVMHELELARLFVHLPLRQVERAQLDHGGEAPGLFREVPVRGQETSLRRSGFRRRALFRLLLCRYWRGQAARQERDERQGGSNSQVMHIGIGADFDLVSPTFNL